MRWGLLAGIGAGLSQGAQMVSQGMAEDRAVRRAEELERMREASFERRWKQQIQREDQLRGEDKAQRANERAEDKALRQQERTDDMKWRQSESNRQAGQFDRQMTQREKQVIEQNLTGIMEQEARAAERIQQRYQKLMADGMGDTTAMQSQMAAELEANQMFYSERLHSMIQSYGPQGLSGTGFEYLLNFANKEEPAAGSNLVEDNQAQPRDLSGLVSKIRKPEQPAAGLLGLEPNYTTDTTGAPELSLSNLMRKWNTPSPNSPVLPKAKTAEQLEEERRNLELVKTRGIQSAYGAAMINSGRN